MRSSYPPRQSSQTFSSALSQISLSAVVQYAFLAVLAYILAGAPLSSVLSSSSSPSSSVLSILSDIGDDATTASAREGKVVDVRKLESLVIPERNLTCKEHRYKGVYVLNRDPLVVYIEGFLGEGEGKEVVELRYVNYFDLWSSSLLNVHHFLLCVCEEGTGEKEQEEKNTRAVVASLSQEEEKGHVRSHLSQFRP